jgi:predicted RNase H-like nuclease
LSILGIDAAWTAKNPSGAALLNRDGMLIVAAPSYSSFVESLNGGVIDWSKSASASGSVTDAITAANSFLPNDPVALVAVDMPVSTVAITGRRECERKVSKAFGAMGCSTHSPSLDRPGPVSEDFSKRMEKAGFRLAVAGETPAEGMFIEVYPHTALLRLMKADYRLPYKESKRSKYWPDATTSERRANLLQEWQRIIQRLEEETGHLNIPLKEPISLKTVEDAIDAVVCAWVGGQFLKGNADGMGDDTAAIWTPGADHKMS